MNALRSFSFHSMKFRFTRCLTCLTCGLIAFFGICKAEVKTNVEGLGTGFTAQELRVLELLSKRREELARKEEELKVKEKMILALERSISSKLAELDALNKMSQEAKSELRAMEEAKAKGLVKIYENMPPRRAAQIFDEMDIETLVGLVSSMKEIKVAAIIANMDVRKARELSICLTKKTLPDLQR